MAKLRAGQAEAGADAEDHGRRRREPQAGAAAGGGARRGRPAQELGQAPVGEVPAEPAQPGHLPRHAAQRGLVRLDPAGGRVAPSP